MDRRQEAVEQLVAEISEMGIEAYVEMMIAGMTDEEVEELLDGHEDVN